MRIGRISVVVVLCLVCQALADGPATTQSAPPHKAEVPPGFHTVTANGRSVFCQPEDDEWVKGAATFAGPATRPATMPSDVIASLQQHRQEIGSMMMHDLSLTDRKPIDDFFDQKVIPELKKIEALKMTVYYFPSTRGKVADLMDGGWTDPRFHYIRFAHDISYSTVAILTIDEPMDDLVWWVELHDGDNTATKRDALSTQINYFETGIQENISTFAKNEAEHLFEGFVHDKAFDSLKLPGRLQWFDYGASNIFAVKYASMITGMSAQAWKERLIGRPDQVRPYLRLDLINSLDPSEIRPEYQSAYARAILPKGALAIDTWLKSAGPDSLARALPALRAHTPATAQELIKVIHDSTGYDMTSVLQPDYGTPATQPAH